MLTGDWRKSSYSSDTANCVEVRKLADVQIRDSKDLDGPVLTVTGNDWLAFLRFVTE